MKILIIDDNELSVKGIIDYCNNNHWENKRIDFNDAYSYIFEYDPDIIILDWREDSDKIDSGEQILDAIWNTTFRPVVLFTANKSIIDVSSKQKESNMLTIIEKGDETPVYDYLSEMEPFITELTNFRRSMSRALISSLNAVDFFKKVDTDASAIEYMLSKRVSAFFDKDYISELSPSFVQYLCPPISSCLGVCDVIRQYNAEKDLDSSGNPEEYLIILTPSCDLYKSQNRHPKVKKAICAKCRSKDKFHNCGLSDEPTADDINTVKTMLNTGYNNKYVPLPGIPSILPFMTVDLKKIDLIKIDEIALDKESINSKTKYIRIASIISPFKEQIVWAHMLNSCRPGVPDRQMDIWAKELLTK